MNPKRFLALALFAWLAAAPAGEARAQWVQTNGPFSVDSSYLLVAGDKYIFVASDLGIQRSSDDGRTWQTINGGSVDKIAASGTNVVAAQTLSRQFPQMDSLYVSFSSNSGASWITIGSNNYSALLALGLIDSFIVNFNNVTLLGATYFGISDFALWSYNGIYSSTDGGHNWAAPDSNFQVTITSLAALGTDLFAGSIDSQHVLFRSTDQGMSWLPSDSGIVTGSVNALLTFDSKLFAGTPNGVFFSTDTGSTWKPCNDFGLANKIIQQLTTVDSQIFASTTQGLFRSSNNGADWTQLAPLSSYTFPGSLVTVGNNLFVGTSYSGVFCSSDGGKSWIPKNYGLPGASYLLESKGTLYTIDGVGFRSIDSGLSWMPIDSGIISEWLYQGDTELILLQPHTFGTIDTILFASTFDGVYKSTDYGQHWRPINSGLDSANGVPTGIKGFATAGSNIWAFANDGVYLSSDEGEHWNFKHPCKGNYDFTVSGSTLLLSENIDYYVPYTERSTDNGLTWNIIDSTAFVDLTFLGRYLFADKDEINHSDHEDQLTIVFSTDSGTTWTDISQGLSNSENSVRSFTLNVNDVFASVVLETPPYYVGLGVWRRPLSEILALSRVQQSPLLQGFSMSVFPNPFSQSTQITFTSQAAGYADVSVVNILGAPVAHLFSGELAAGEHDFAWDAQEMALGSYWCMVRMGDSVDRIALSVER